MEKQSRQRDSRERDEKRERGRVTVKVMRGGKEGRK